MTLHTYTILDPVKGEINDILDLIYLNFQRNVKCILELEKRTKNEHFKIIRTRS